MLAIVYTYEELLNGLLNSLLTGLLTGPIYDTFSYTTITEKDAKLALKMQVGPCTPVGIQR